MEEIKHHFKALSNRDQLRKYLKGKSHNKNESLNNVIWTWLQKRTFVNLNFLQFDVHEAAFNYGYVSNDDMSNVDSSPSCIILKNTKMYSFYSNRNFFF